MKSKAKYIIAVIAAVIVCVFIANFKISVSVNVDDNINALASVISIGQQNSEVAAPFVQIPQSTAPTASAPAVQQTEPSAQQNTDASVSASSMPTETKDIIDKYSLLVNKFKQEKPAYKKKEFQSLPEEYRNFGTGINVILDLASGYMVSEEDAEELVRSANCEDIVWDMPVHNTDKGCLLTDYSAVTWAKCEDNGDGTYKISFSLKEEVNAAPTSPETLTPTSAHGAVMQPANMDDIKTEVDKVTSKVPGLAVNQFDLTYRECVFECVYNPQADEVKSITHHIVIDINADVKLFVSDINGSARLLNEMYIYDITW